MLKNCKKYNMSIAVNTLFIKGKINSMINSPLYILFFAGVLLAPNAFAKTIKNSPMLPTPSYRLMAGTSCTGAAAVYTSVAPVIDGTADAVWSQAPVNTLSQTISGTIQTGSTWQALYDATNLYILVQVKDANLSNAGTNVYDQDGVEIFIAANNSKSTGGYTSTEHQYRFNWNVAATTANISGTTNGTTGITYSIPSSTGGYTLEVAIPWSTIGGTAPTSGKAVGFDVNLNDQQNGGGPREATVGWNSTSAYDYSSPSNFGTITLCANAPVIAIPASINASIGTTFNYTISASNLPTSYAVSNLPAGLSVNSTTGVISGTPTATGNFTTTITATNSGGTGSQILIITVAPAAGTVTSIAPGYGLTGSTITTTGTLTIDTAALSTKYLRRSDSATAYTSLKRLSDTAASIRTAIATASAQTFIAGNSGSDFTITNTGATHTFNIPTASALNRGALSATDWNTFNSKPSLSGTTNYVAKITGSNTLGSSQIFDNGTNVGIGTTSINSADYKLYVEIGIRTRKVKIDQLTWADYVFDKNYLLPSLADVEKYIEQNKRLPGVPSTQDVSNNGVDIGDNQAMLLKKIEELTLYMIDLNKKVEALSKENKLLKKKINTIKK
jgi:hypothetical protein